MVAICAATLTVKAQTVDNTIHEITAVKIAPKWVKMSSPKADRLGIRLLNDDFKSQSLYYAMYLYTSDTTAPKLLLGDNTTIAGEDYEQLKASTNPLQFIFNWFANQNNITLQ